MYQHKDVDAYISVSMQMILVMLVCLAAQRLLLMLLYVCQPADGTVDAFMSISTQGVLLMLLYVCQPADGIGDAFMSISTQGVLLMLLCLSACRWYW